MEDKYITLTDEQKHKLQSIANSLRCESDFIERRISSNLFTKDMYELYIKVDKILNE